MTKNSRRQFLATALPLTVGSQLGFGNTQTIRDASASTGKKMKIVVVGAHPDDPETICGGVMALYAGMGHEVVSVYLTRGEAGIEGKSHEEAVAIRTAEALTACKILKVRPEFVGQIDGSCEITAERYAPLLALFKKEEPDLIFTHWPIDSHRDHRICSILVYDAWLKLGRKSSLYYCEAMSGVQSQNFAPTDYVDISSVIDQKHQACFAHVSQEMAETYKDHHGKMEKYRGMEFGCEYAEAFVRHVKNPAIYLK